jgi:hypothetical protein
MQRSSNSIGALAAALAKAQSEIANPEKSLTATIVSPFPREGVRSFRYAPLSAGLDVVRKCLGRHEIATVQTTAIDGDSGLIKLTTTLAHTSGEWVSSDFPVCAVSETAAPHRLGTALTYARRYALFTLVGIAGEDDLDAPDLSPATITPASTSVSQTFRQALQPKPTRPERLRPARLSAEASEVARRELIAELEQLREPEALASWAQRALPVKNQLSTVDAEAVEAAFAARLSEVGGKAPSPRTQKSEMNGNISRQEERIGLSSGEVTVIGKPVPERDRNHRRFVATQPCLICGRTPSDPHHIKFAEHRAMGRKVSDRFTVPICRLHHRELHRRGDERIWWQQRKIDPLIIAASLWERTHAVASVSSNVASEINQAEKNQKLNGRQLSGSAGAALHPQNNETKPILGPEMR